MTLEKIRPGQRLKIPAATWNAMTDSARESISRKRAASSKPPKSSHSAEIVMVRNDSGADVGRFAILGNGGPIIEPNDQSDPAKKTQNTAEFSSRVTVKGVTPAETHFGAFVVTLGPIADGEIGRAVIAGTTVVSVEMRKEIDRYADVNIGDTSTMLSGPVGSARLLYRQPSADRDTGAPKIALAIVRLGVIGVGVLREAVVVCVGPSGQATPTDESYWVQWADWQGGDLALPAVPNAGGNEVVLATSRSEIPTHTHTIRAGTPVLVHQVIDDDGNWRWVF